MTRRAPMAVWFAAGLGVAALAAPFGRLIQQHSEKQNTGARLAALDVPRAATCAVGPGVFSLPAGAGLASWQTIGGCGAGSASGIGGIKWIGRNVRGGLVNVQCQGNYTSFDNGHSYSLTNQLTSELSNKWVVGVVVPYLYKWIDDPLQLGWDLSNQGLGDINLMVTRRLGAINATSITASVGLPTGTSEAGHQVYKLPQDRQLGAGTFSGAVLVDHTLDHLWGPAVVGATASYPGAKNDIENYRAPSASAYGYVGYLLADFVPALGLATTAYFGDDLDTGLPNKDRPPFMAAVNGSLEWSSDWVALLAGISFPFSTKGMEPWTVGLGFSLAPF